MASSKTRVLGYFSPQRYNVNITSSAMGLNMTIPPKGFVLDRAGNKINDPRLEAYVGPNMLAREMSPVDVDLRVISSGMAVQAPVSPNSGFKATTTMPANASGKAANLPLVRQAPQPPMVAQPPASGNPVRAMTIEEARRLGYIKSTYTPVEGPKDDSTDPRSAVGAPAIEYARDVPNKNVKAVKVAPVIIEKPDGAVAKLVEASKLDIDSPDLLTRVVKAVTGKPAAEEAAPESAPSDSLPESTIQEQVADVQDPAEATPATTSKRFICFVDGKDFDYRSQLEKWAKRKHPALADKIMAPYPPLSSKGIAIS